MENNDYLKNENDKLNQKINKEEQPLKKNTNSKEHMHLTKLKGYGGLICRYKTR